jgi:hypothetical protein
MPPGPTLLFLLEQRDDPRADEFSSREQIVEDRAG